MTMPSTKPTVVAHASRMGGWSLASLCRTVLLPTLLLLAQQGALLHGLSHYLGPEAQGPSEQPHSSTQPCDVCLAFAQVASTATAAVALPPMLVDRSFAPALPTPATVVPAEVRSHRNRGPPAVV